MRQIKIYPAHYHKGHALVDWYPERTVTGQKVFGLTVRYVKQRSVANSVRDALLLLPPNKLSDLELSLQRESTDLSSLVTVLDSRALENRALVEVALQARVIHHALGKAEMSVIVSLTATSLKVELETGPGYFISAAFQEVLHDLEKHLYARLKFILT